MRVLPPYRVPPKGSRCALSVQVHRLCDPSFVVRPDAANLESGVTEVILGAGDVMYHNAGVWHLVETLEDSLSVSYTPVMIMFLTANTVRFFHMAWTASSDRERDWRGRKRGAQATRAPRPSRARRARLPLWHARGKPSP